MDIHKNTPGNSKLHANATKSVCWRLLSAKFPCRTGQEIAYNPPLSLAAERMCHCIAISCPQQFSVKDFR